MGELSTTMDLKNPSWTFWIMDFTTNPSTYNSQMWERVETFSFSNRLNDNMPLVSVKWLNEYEPNMNIILKNQNSGNIFS